jgi:Baseplate J-like protein
MTAFRTRGFVEIVSHMLGHMRAAQKRVTDFNIGSVARTMLEAPAASIDQLYQEMAQGLIEGIPTAIYRSFDFDLLPAQHAAGYLRVVARTDRTLPVTIPIGWLAAAADGRQYRAVEQGVIPLGGSVHHVDVLATAVREGPTGNAAPGTINRVVSAGAFVAGVSNPGPFANGRGVESEGERKLRFVEFVKTLARCTPRALEYIAKSTALVDPKTGQATERIIRASIEETTGHVFLHVHNGVGGTSDAIVARLAERIEGSDTPAGDPVPGWRPCGMRVDTVKMSEIVVPASIKVRVPAVHRTEELKQRIRVAMGGVIRAVPSGGRLRPYDLAEAALAIAEVEETDLLSPLAAVQCPRSAVLLPGTVAVDWLT